MSFLTFLAIEELIKHISSKHKLIAFFFIRLKEIIFATVTRNKGINIKNNLLENNSQLFMVLNKDKNSVKIVIIDVMAIIFIFILFEKSIKLLVL